MASSVAQIYQREIAARGFQSDPAQLHAVQALERCVREWADFGQARSGFLKKLFGKPGNIPRGVYMYGGVGASSRN